MAGIVKNILFAFKTVGDRLGRGTVCGEIQERLNDVRKARTDRPGVRAEGSVATPRSMITH